MNRSSGIGSQGLNIGAFLLGVLFLAGALVFLCAAVQNAGRFPLALVLLVIGGGLAVWAGMRWRKARQLSPDVLDDRILDLAAANNAEIGLSRVMGELDLPDDVARAALARLEANGLCHQEHRESKSVYVFPEMQESKVIRRCAYCGNEYSVRETLHKCPNCGGNLEIAKT